MIFTEKNDPLDKDQLAEMLKRISEGDQNARQIVIERCLRFVNYIILRYQTSGIEKDDLFSIGVIGLVKGVDRYDYNKFGVNAFSTYIGRAIENELLMQIRHNKKVIKPISLEEVINEEQISHGSSDLTLKQCLQSNDICSDDAIARAELVNKLHEIILTLSDREQYIIKSYFGLGDINQLKLQDLYQDYYGTNEKSMVQHAIAKNLKISRSYVSRIVKEILEKIKIELELENIFLLKNK